MALVDQIINMRRQGADDSNIINELQQQGISPREINDGLAQSRIKEAVGGMNDMNNSSMEMQGEFNPLAEGMQPSMMDQPPINYAAEGYEGMQNASQEIQGVPQQGPYAQEMEYANYPPMQQEQYNYPPQSYGQESYPAGYEQGQGYENYGTMSGGYGASETISEIAEQVFEKRMRKSTKLLGDLAEIKTLMSAKVEKIDERLTQIEKIIDQLQSTLIRKSSEQEQNVEDIKSELQQMQDGFGKIINPLIDIERNIEKTPRLTSTRKTPTTHKKSKK